MAVSNRNDVSSDASNHPRHAQPPELGGRGRRRYSRYALTAQAWVTDFESNKKLRASITDISLGGCHVDFLEEVPDYADIMVNIARESGNFESYAEVVFNHPRLGMGIRFVDTRPSQSAVLHRWILELAAIHC